MLKTIACADIAAFGLSCEVPGVAAETFPAPALVGVWQDGHADLLPPGVAHFEAISSRIVFMSGGNFMLTADKAAGSVSRTGAYAVTAHVLTLRFPTGTASYGFSCSGDTLTLQDHGASPAKPIMLRQMPAH